MITEKDIPDLRRLWQQAFGDTDPFLDKFFRVGFSFDRCRCIREGEEIVAALYWFDCDWNGKKVAYIYAVATEEAHRGKGLCRNLMEDTHSHLWKNSYGGAVLVPGDRELSSLYAKFGYQSFYPVKRAATATEKTPAAKNISPAEYAQLRKTLAGENAILQDISALDFLATYGGFYKTEKAVFCGYWEGNAFHFEEALGTLSLPQTDSLPAMYLSLDGNADLPGYFAIPLI